MKTIHSELEIKKKQAAKVIAIEKFEDLLDERKSKGGTITANNYADIYNFDKEGPYGDSNKDSIWHNHETKTKNEYRNKHKNKHKSKRVKPKVIP